MVGVMDDRIKNLIDECKRQEESCLYTSTSLFEWQKSLRWRKNVFVIVPIILGGFATWPLLTHQDGLEWVTGICALLAGFAPAIYKALDFDVNLDVIGKHAQQFKILQDRFRQAWSVTALRAAEDFQKSFDDLMTRMDTVRSSSPAVPERSFKEAKNKIRAGHYEFNVDLENKVSVAHE